MGKSSGRIRFAPLLLIFALMLIFAVALTLHDRESLPSALIGQPIPEFNLPSLFEDQPDVNRSALISGKPFVVNIWASYCLPCRQEHAELKKIQARGYDVIGIDFRDKRESAKKFLRQLGNPFTLIGFDSNGRASVEWGATGVPESFVVDEFGVIKYKHIGPIQNDDVERVILPKLGAGR